MRSFLNDRPSDLEPFETPSFHGGPRLLARFLSLSARWHIALQGNALQCVPGNPGPWRKNELTFPGFGRAGPYARSVAEPYCKYFPGIVPGMLSGSKANPAGSSGQFPACYSHRRCLIDGQKFQLRSASPAWYATRSPGCRFLLNRIVSRSPIMRTIELIPKTMTAALFLLCMLVPQFTAAPNAQPVQDVVYLQEDVESAP